MLHGKVTQSSDTRLLSYIYQHHQYCQNNCSQHHHHRNTGHFLSFFLSLSAPRGFLSGALNPKGGCQWLSPARGVLSGALGPNGGSQ